MSISAEEVLTNVVDNAPKLYANNIKKDNNIDILVTPMSPLPSIKDNHLVDQSTANMENLPPLKNNEADNN